MILPGRENSSIQPGDIVLDAKGLIRHEMCGDAELMLVDMKRFCDAAYDELAADPESWCNDATRQWLKTCKEFW